MKFDSKIQIWHYQRKNGKFGHSFEIFKINSQKCKQTISIKKIDICSVIFIEIITLCCILDFCFSLSTIYVQIQRELIKNASLFHAKQLRK